MTVGDPYVAPGPQKPKKNKALVVVLALIGFVVLACGIGAIVIDANAENKAPVKIPSYGTTPVTTAPTTQPTRPSPSSGTGIVLPAAPVKAAPVTIGEGVWEVGSDVKAGKYKLLVSPDPDANCYWEITRDDAGQDIVSNDLPTGGHPQVTLKKGQFFHTQDCGAWTLVK